MRPRDIITQWVRRFNQADANLLSNLYHEDAINHQVNSEPIFGRNAIRKQFENEFAIAKMVCEVENIFEDGSWAILEWKDPLGLRGSGFFYIENNLIKHQRGYWDRLSFLRIHQLPLPKE